MESNLLSRNILIVVILFMCGCGESGNKSNDPVTLYDEVVDGPLPYSFINLSDVEIASYTFAVGEGVNVVKGTSTSGETFALDVPSGLYIKSIEVAFHNHIDANDKMTIINRRYGSQVLWDAYNLPVVGDYNYRITLPDRSIGNGVYDVYSGTSVQGASNENSFTLSFEIARIIR